MWRDASYSWTGTLILSNNSSIFSWSSLIISGDTKRCVSSRSLNTNFLPSASCWSKCSRNCFIAGSLKVQWIGVMVAGMSTKPHTTYYRNNESLAEGPSIFCCFVIHSITVSYTLYIIRQKERCVDYESDTTFLAKMLEYDKDFISS